MSILRVADRWTPFFLCGSSEEGEGSGMRAGRNRPHRRRIGAPMNTLAAWRSLNRDQKNAFLAAFLGWALDAFDYFLVVFVISEVGKEFHASDSKVSLATFLTLAFRPAGALIFGVLGDRFGRRVPLMVDIILYSFLELITGFAPNMTAFLVIRALFGIGMGG